MLSLPSSVESRQHEQEVREASASEPVAWLRAFGCDSAVISLGCIRWQIHHMQSGTLSQSEPLHCRIPHGSLQI